MRPCVRCGAPYQSHLRGGPGGGNIYNALCGGYLEAWPPEPAPAKAPEPVAAPESLAAPKSK